MILFTQLNVKTVLFQVIQFSISTYFSSIWPIDRTLSGATTPSQHYWNLIIRFSSVISIRFSSVISGHSLRMGLTPSTEMQSVYSTVPTDWATCRLFHNFWSNMLYSHEQRYIHVCMQKHIQHNKDEQTQFFWKIYLSLYLKGSKGLRRVLLWERWVGDWTELQHIDPHSSGHSSVSFPFSWAAQPGAWGPSFIAMWFSFQHLLSNWLELPVHLVILVFYAHLIQTGDSQGYSLISSTGCTCYLHRCISYFDSLVGSEVNMQQI